MHNVRLWPTLSVIDKRDILRYAGPIDDDQTSTNRDGAMDYLVNAVRQLAAVKAAVVATAVRRKRRSLTP